MGANPKRPSEEAPLTARLVSACQELDYDSLPPSVRRQAKLVVLDTVGAMLSASRPSFPGTERMATFVEAQGAGECRVVGTEARVSAPHAALMNGYLAYAMDIESHHGPSVVHAAAAVIPAGLASAQEAGSDGASLLAAVVLGIEVACRVSLAIGPNDLYSRGFHPTSVAGAFGAAAASGAILNLDRRQLERAMGLAATQTCGLLAWASDETEESRPFNPGLAARNGVTAARLAALGFGAPQDIFDTSAKYNVFRAWSLDAKGDPTQLVAGFGESYAVTEMIFKQYACCAFLHPAVDGLLSILETELLDSHDIAAIVAHFPRSGAPIIDNNPLRSHRAQYILPVAAVRRKVRFEDVIADRSSEPEIQRLAAVTSLVHDDVLDRYYPQRYTTRIEVQTHAGRSHDRLVEWAKGTPENPLHDDDIRWKFRELATQRISRDHADHLVALIENLDQAEGLADIWSGITVSAE